MALLYLYPSACVITEHTSTRRQRRRRAEEEEEEESHSYDVAAPCSSAVQHASCPWQSPYSTAWICSAPAVHPIIRDRSLVAVCLQACIAAMRPFLHAARVRTEGNRLSEGAHARSHTLRSGDPRSPNKAPSSTTSKDDAKMCACVPHTSSSYQLLYLVRKARPSFYLP
jgi:hypothetical protein